MSSSETLHPGLSRRKGYGSPTGDIPTDQLDLYLGRGLLTAAMVPTEANIYPHFVLQFPEASDLALFVIIFYSETCLFFTKFPNE